jgi:hypothetical protein
MRLQNILDITRKHLFFQHCCCTHQLFITWLSLGKFLPRLDDNVWSCNLNVMTLKQFADVIINDLSTGVTRKILIGTLVYRKTLTVYVRGSRNSRWIIHVKKCHSPRSWHTDSDLTLPVSLDPPSTHTTTTTDSQSTIDGWIWITYGY